MPIDPLSIDDAIQLTCRSYTGGARALAACLGVNAGTFANKCNPSMTAHVINLNEARAMMEVSGDFRILEALATALHHACMANFHFREVSDMDLFDAWSEWDLEHGRTAEALRRALADRCIHQTEYAQVRAEMFDDFGRELALLQRLSLLSTAANRQSPPAPDDLKHAALETLKLAPDSSQLASRLGMREIELRKKSDPAFPDQIFNIYETRALMEETGQYLLLHTLAESLDHTCVEIPRYTGVNDMELLDAWSGWNSQRGDTVGLIHKALTDGLIGDLELRDIRTGMYADFEKELALLARLESLLG